MKCGYSCFQHIIEIFITYAYHSVGMEAQISINSVASGFNYTAFDGAETDKDGNLNKASADRIIGGWAATKAKAEQKARSALADE